VVLTAGAFQRLPVLAAACRLRIDRHALQGMAAIIVLILYATSWSNRLPGMVYSYAHNFFNSHPDFIVSLTRQVQKPALVFVGNLPKNPRDKKADLTRKYFWVADTNPSGDYAPIIFARDLGMAKNKRLMDYYPPRHAYLERDGHLYPIDPDTLQSTAPDMQP
jgi:hypothetical protein